MTRLLVPFWGGGRERVAEPFRSHESTALAHSAPPSVDSSAERNPRLHIREAGGSIEGRSRSHSRASLSRHRESQGERRCACSQSAGSCDRSRKSRSHSTDRLRSLGRVRSRQAPSHSRATRKPSRRSHSGCSRSRGYLARSRDRGASLSFPLTDFGHGRGAGGQGIVAWIYRKLMLSPRILATLGPVQVLSLWLLAVPSQGSSLRCVTSPGCSSVCRGHATSGM